MNQVDNLSDAANQTSQLVLDDGSVASITLTYLAAVQRWQLDVTYNDFVVQGVNLCVSLNVLAPWRRKIPFGLACISVDGVDPAYPQDFVGVNGAAARVGLYILMAAEVAQAAKGTLG